MPNGFQRVFFPALGVDGTEDEHEKKYYRHLHEIGAKPRTVDEQREKATEGGRWHRTAYKKRVIPHFRDAADSKNFLSS